MTALFVALGIMVLALLTLLLWFVPRLLQQQVVRVSDESAQLREMLLDLLSEQEAVTIRQTQLGAAIAQLQARFDVVAPDGGDTIAMIDRMNELQQTLQTWAEQRTAQAHPLDGSAMNDTIDAVLIRLDVMQTQMRDTATIVDEGVLIGIRQLSDRVHALQIQLEAWVDTLVDQQSSETHVLTDLQQQLHVIQQRIDDTATMQREWVDTTDLTAMGSTTPMSDEPTTVRLDTESASAVDPSVASDDEPQDAPQDPSDTDASSRDTPPQTWRL